MRDGRDGYLQDEFIGLVVDQDFVWLQGSGDHYRQNYVTELLAGGVRHDATHGLHHICLRVARGQEQHGIQGEYVYPFRQSTHVAKDAASQVCSGAAAFNQLSFPSSWLAFMLASKCSASQIRGATVSNPSAS